MDRNHQLAAEVFQVSRRWRALLDERLRVMGASKSSWVVLYWLSRTPEGLSQRELAEQVGVETSTLTRQLAAMEAQGLVERSSVDGDRRLKRVRLTDLAWPQLEQVGRITAEVREQLLEGVDPLDLDAALRVLRHVHERFA